MGETDIIICLNKKKQGLKEYQRYYREARRSAYFFNFVFFFQCIK